MGIKCCQNCTQREVGCHSRCPTYLAEKQEHNETKNEIRKYKKAYSDLYDQRSIAVNKAYRRHK